MTTEPIPIRQTAIVRTRRREFAEAQEEALKVLVQYSVDAAVIAVLAVYPTAVTIIAIQVGSSKLLDWDIILPDEAPRELDAEVELPGKRGMECLSLSNKLLELHAGLPMNRPDLLERRPYKFADNDVDGPVIVTQERQMTRMTIDVAAIVKRIRAYA